MSQGAAQCPGTGGPRLGVQEVGTASGGHHWPSRRRRDRWRPRPGGRRPGRRRCGERIRRWAAASSLEVNSSAAASDPAAGGVRMLTPVAPSPSPTTARTARQKAKTDRPRTEVISLCDKGGTVLRLVRCRSTEGLSHPGEEATIAGAGPDCRRSRWRGYSPSTADDTAKGPYMSPGPTPTGPTIRPADEVRRPRLR